MEDIPTDEKINYTLAVLTPRIIDKGSTIKYYNNYYQFYDANNRLQCFMPKSECLVIKAFDGSLLAFVDNDVYQLKQLVSHKMISDNMDFVEVNNTKKTSYIPPMSHPWKRSSFDKQMKKAHKERIYN